MESILKDNKIRRCIIRNMKGLSAKQRRVVESYYDKPLDAEIRFYTSTLDANPGSKMARTWLLDHKEWLSPSQKKKLTKCCNMNNLQKRFNNL